MGFYCWVFDAVVLAGSVAQVHFAIAYGFLTVHCVLFSPVLSRRVAEIKFFFTLRLPTVAGARTRTQIRFGRYSASRSPCKIKRLLLYDGPGNFSLIIDGILVMVDSWEYPPTKTEQKLESSSGRRMLLYLVHYGFLYMQKYRLFGERETSLSILSVSICKPSSKFLFYILTAVGHFS